MDLAALGPYCQDLGLILSQYGPHAWLIKYIYTIMNIYLISLELINGIFILQHLDIHCLLQLSVLAYSSYYHGLHHLPHPVVEILEGTKN